MTASPFWKFREENRVARWFFSVYGVLAFLWACSWFWFAPPEGHWSTGLLLGLLGWGATSQGLTVYSEFILSLELGVYLFAFLVVGPSTALQTLLVTTVISVVYGMVDRPADRTLEFLLRKLGNFFILGVSLMAACAVYTAAGGPGTLEVIGLREALALGLFWLVFAVLNNAFFVPVDWVRSAPGEFLPRFARETSLDSFLHLLSVLTGAGFAVVFVQLGLLPILLLLPAMVVTLLALRRGNDQRKALALQLESLQRLNESSNQLHISLDLREVLDAVESVCRGLFHADTYFMGMLDERSGRVEYVRAVEQGRVLTLETADLSQGLTGHVMRTAQAIFPDDMVREEPWRSMVRKVGDTSHPIRSLMMGPLVHKGRVIGVLSVQSLKPRAYQPFQKQLFLQVCQQVVTAVAGARLYRRATEDFLTRLYNKSFFEERLSSLLKEGKPFGLIFMDCDNFKDINDNLGHVVGDQYLEALGKRLMGLCRSSDVPCRYGGDEFALLLPGANGEQTRRIAARVHDAVRRLEFPVKDQVARTTASMGTLWSGGNRTGLPVEDVLRKVDASLYKAKSRRDSIEETTL